MKKLVLFLLLAAPASFPLHAIDLSPQETRVLIEQAKKNALGRKAAQGMPRTISDASFAVVALGVTLLGLEGFRRAWNWASQK